MLVNEKIKPLMMTADKPAIRMKTLKLNHFILPPVEMLARTK